VRRISLFCCVLLVLVLSTNALGEPPQEELALLLLFYEEKDLVLSATRHEKPVSQTAENISIVTEEEIKSMNAHTVTDVLNTIPGVQIEIKGGPGIIGLHYIQGSEERHVLVLVDGVTLNSLGEGLADLSALPVHNIKRIEIIKGPGSSTWGSSLGGVINIITKSPAEIAEGGASVSYGERGTVDLKANASGRKGRLGYFLSAGRLKSNGMWPHTPVSIDTFYSKLSLELFSESEVHFTFGYNGGDRGLGEFTEYDFTFDVSHEYLFSTLSLESRISDNASLNISLRASRQDTDHFMDELNTGMELDRSSYLEEAYGTSAKFVYEPEAQIIVVGADYDSGTWDYSTVGDEGKEGINKWAVYANDTVVLGRWSVTPGLRYDYSDIYGDFTSPSLGITFSPVNDVLLRAAVARGFGLPTLSHTYGTSSWYVKNPDIEVEKVWSYQAGVETAALKYVWAKVTAFRHDLEDGITDVTLPDDTFTSENLEEIRRQGVEVEARTVPFYNTSLFAGYVFIDAEDLDTGEDIYNVAKDTWDVGVEFKTEGFNGNMRGHYIDWTGYYDKDATFVWDLNLFKRFYMRGRITAEAFFSAHNLFNAEQYYDERYKNPERWVEAGIGVVY
jgi:vitamin B12 transporter